MPPLAWGQVSTCCPAPVKMSSGFSVTAPDPPSMWLMTFWVMVGLAHRELAGLAVEGVDDAGLPRDAGDDPARLSRLHAGVDPVDGGGVGSDRGVD